MTGRTLRSTHRHCLRRPHTVDLALPTAEMSPLRVAERVGHRGHSIPAADKARRFPRSLWNLLELYAGAVDDASCFINSGPAPDIVFTQQGNQRAVLDRAVFDPLVKAAKP